MLEWMFASLLALAHACQPGGDIRHAIGSLGLAQFLSSASALDECRRQLAALRQH